MFDTILALGPEQERFSCAHGHVLRELQTKDLGEPALVEYVLHDARLHEPVRLPGERPPRSAVASAVGLLLRTDVPLEPFPFTGAALVYGHCDACDPVLFLGGGDTFWDLVKERRPFCEWELQLSGGALEGVEPVRVETREELRAALGRSGLEVLDDDDRIARRHRALLEARREEGDGRRGRRRP